MSDHLRKLTLGFAVVCSLAAFSAVRAQVSDVAGTFYGQGVDEFFAGRSNEAAASFDRSISANPNDPRAYYFRALARLRVGDSDGARADMMAGAAVESRLPNRYAIGKSLERVQGYDRLELEKYRRTARMNVVTTAKPIVPVAGQQPLTSTDAAVLRDNRMVPIDEFRQQGTPQLVPVPQASQASAAGALAPVTKAAAPAAAVANEGDPFADDAAGKAKVEPAHAAAVSETTPVPAATTVTPAKSDVSAPAAAAATKSETDPFDDAAANSQPAAPPKGPPQGTPTPRKSAGGTGATLAGKVDATKATPPAKAALPKTPPQSKDAGGTVDPFQ